jgi:hypothetical protein
MSKHDGDETGSRRRSYGDRSHGIIIAVVGSSQSRHPLLREWFHNLVNNTANGSGTELAATIMFILLGRLVRWPISLVIAKHWR